MTTAADHRVVIHSLKAVNEREGREGSDLRMNDREAKRGGGRSADRPACVIQKLFKTAKGRETKHELINQPEAEETLIATANCSFL